ncbi:MAG TPA: glycosyltransferase family 4 protein [Rhodocyclaceae bacterium]
MKPKVLHIHFWADIRNSAGSVEKVITAFAAHGERYAHAIACCPSGRPAAPATFRHHGVEVHSFHENRLQNRILNKMLRRGAFTYGSLVRLIDRLRPDILHFHNRQELVDAVMRRLAHRPKVAVHYHRHFADPCVPAAADLLLFISDATAADILGKRPSRKPYRVVANPLSVEVLAHAQGGAEPSRNTPPVILFGGGANPIKGGRELVEAFLALPAGSARLVLAGRGVEKFGITAPNIEVLGEVPADRFFELMRKADVVAMPSYDEPFGLIAQEAMLMGKLLVSTATGGLADFVDASSAVVVAPRDVASLRDGLARALELLSRDAELRRLLDRARANIDAYSPDKIVSLLEACYDNIHRQS